MKVLFVTGLTGFGLGGARTEEIRLVRGAADKGCDVAMCSDVLAGELLGIRHFRLDYPPAEKAPEQLARALDEFQPEIVHVVGGGVRFLADCNRAIARARMPWVFTAHNVPPAERIFPRLYRNIRLHYAVRNALALPNVWSWAKYLKRSRFHTAICHSQTVAKRLREVGCPAGKIHEIPFGSELPESAFDPQPEQGDQLWSGPSQSEPGRVAPVAPKAGVRTFGPTGLTQPGSDKVAPVAPKAGVRTFGPTGLTQPGSPVFPEGAWPKIVTIAGLAFHKAQLDAVRLAARLLPDFPKLSYRLIGMTRDKKYRAYVEKTIRDLGLSEHISIIHSAPEALKFAALREADLYVQPSHEEGFCIAFLEAAMLVPRLIGADTGAIAAMGEGDATCRIVRPGDIEGLDRAARELIAKKVEATTVRERRATLARRYSWDAYLDAHLETYRQVLAGNVQ